MQLFLALKHATTSKSTPTQTASELIRQIRQLDSSSQRLSTPGCHLHKKGSAGRHPLCSNQKERTPHIDLLTPPPPPPPCPNETVVREKPKIEKLQEILGGPDPAEDDGWDDVVEKKSVVATGGKHVSDLM